MKLGFKPGFDATRLKWGAPDEPPADDCSYCGAELPEDGVPLMMWSDPGACAQLCDACVDAWVTTVPETTSASR